MHCTAWPRICRRRMPCCWVCIVLSNTPACWLSYCQPHLNIIAYNGLLVTLQVYGMPLQPAFCCCFLLAACKCYAALGHCPYRCPANPNEATAIRHVTVAERLGRRHNESNWTLAQNSMCPGRALAGPGHTAECTKFTKAAAVQRCSAYNHSLSAFK
jgi:hypothetical protein